MGWVHASERLSLLHLGKASRGNAKVKTGIGKSDLPGLQGGPRKRDLVIYDKVRASRLYPDQWGEQVEYTRCKRRFHHQSTTAPVVQRIRALLLASVLIQFGAGKSCRPSVLIVPIKPSRGLQRRESTGLRR